MLLLLLLLLPSSSPFSISDSFPSSPTVVDNNFNNNYELLPLPRSGLSPPTSTPLIAYEKDGEDFLLYTMDDPTNPNSPWSSTNFEDDRNQIKSAFTADMDGDGYPDIIVGEDNQDLGILFNTYNPSDSSPTTDFTSLVDIHVGSNCANINRLTAVDMNGDGCPDILTVCKDNDRVKLFKNPCGSAARTGSSWSYQDLWVGSSSYNKPVVVRTADFNNDGKLDIVIGMEDKNANGVVVRAPSEASS